MGADQVDASAILLSAAASAQHAADGDHAAALAHAESGLARLGRPGEAVEALTDLVRERPRDEEVLLELRCPRGTSRSMPSSST
ncbi:MAG: hypothetical protein AUI10_07860 [Actinobacteria bacterium 13_2_20CM_2_72_6]|nr:MAG: hypothetical protein AUI10_07860 [Actinobacteria bacterium 13_2_20CM_2_72_6]